MGLQGVIAAPPGNRLEALKRDLNGRHSIRVNDQWRVVFRWEAGDAHDVEIVITADEYIMLPNKRTPTHPGEILSEEILKPLGLTQVKLADHLGVPVQRVNELVRGKRGVTPETAWTLAGAFGTTPEFWLHLQVNHDLVRARPTRGVRRLAASA